MKKLLGISVIAMLAVAPAFADPTPAPVGTGSTPANDASASIIETNPPFALAMAADTDGNAASAGYVKGAYNAAIKAINKVNDKVNSELATSAGNGIAKNNGAFSVKAVADGGIAVDSNGVAVDYGTSLDMTGTAGSKKLDVKVGNGIQKNGTSGAVEVKAKSNSGIAVDSNGVAAVVDGTTIAVDSSNGAIKIVAGGVGTTQLADGAVTTDKLGADAVTNAKLADDAVEAANIKDGEVTFVKMASGAVVTAGTSNNDKLTTQGYVDNAISGLSISDYATQTGVDNTINALSATTTVASNAALASGAVSGTATVEIMDTWGSDTPAALSVTHNLSVGTTINQATYNTTINKTAYESAQGS